MTPKVAIIWLCYGNLRHLPEVVASWASLTYPKDRLVIYVVPAGSPDGIADVLRRDVLPRAGKDLPEMVLFDTEKNEGFPKNNNVAIADALTKGCDYVYLQNGDLKLHADAITEAVAMAECDEKIGSVQSLVCYWHEQEKVNCSGGIIHVAGYGYARHNGSLLRDVTIVDGEAIAYSSGAAVLYRSSVLQTLGMLDEGFFMYHEDLELGLRMTIAGYRNVIAARSVGYHDYRFSANPQKFAWTELYRIVVLLSYLRIRTLALLAPLLLAIEIGTCAMALRGGWVGAKAWAYGQWFRGRTWRFIFRMRRRAQKIRTISDAELMRLWTGRIEAQEQASVIVDRFANPIVSGIWRVLYRGILW